MSTAEPYCLAHALAYAAMGWPVLPLAPGEKRPAGALVPRGFLDATTDPEVIRRWFELAPGAGVGIYPGPARLLVLDLDDKPGSPIGADALTSIEAMHEELPCTLVQRTPSGGQARHLLLALPEGFDPARIGNAKLAPGIDVRCSSGYIGAEPSRVRLADGREAGYAFDDWDVLPGELPGIAEAPDWLLALLTLQAHTPATRQAEAPAQLVPPQHVDPRTVAELRSALNALEASDYETWIACGHALRGLGNVGRELWLTWSQQSEKWQPVDAQKWPTFKPAHTGYTSIFAKAQAAGWVNPASTAARFPAAEGPQPAAPAEPPFRLVPVEDLDTAHLPAQAWVLDGYIPPRALTLIGAHGGAGKTTVALMLAVSVAVGLPLFGVPTVAQRVVFFSGEDDADTLRRRLQGICRALGVPASMLAGRLVLLDATQGEPLLYDEGRFVKVDGDDVWQGPGTPTCAALGALIEEAGEPVLLIVDNASDTFGGEEVARKQVREFVRLLVSLVKKAGGAVALLAHIDKNAAKGFGSGESYSGSTAWHNSARSRLTIKRDRDHEDRLVIEHEKSNHGRKREPLHLVWPRDGLPQLDAPQSGVMAQIEAGNTARAVLRLVHEFTQRGEFISTATTSRTHAGALLRGQAGFPARLDNAGLFDVLRAAERRGWLARVAYTGKDRKARERWEVTPAGEVAGEIDPVAATAATCATTEAAALREVPAGAAATAATSPPGGVGGRVRTWEPPQALAAELPATADQAMQS